MEDTYGCNLINTKRDGRQVRQVSRTHPCAAGTDDVL